MVGVAHVADGDAEQGDGGVVEEAVEEMVAVDAVRALVGGVVEFDGAEDAGGGAVGDDEVDVLAGDPVEGGLEVAAGWCIEEVGQADVAVDGAARGDERVEPLEEGAFRLRVKVGAGGVAAGIDVSLNRSRDLI